ncbi:unnamed protein product [Phytophthora lilii]|uniref:RxLR effector protein n=1 Tax=Phytophthora lilii TaxID=2077276 RepID=A0A9W7CKQ6_9STRA|nr:unnamed protein product [Phytophthora lilii]
MTSFSLQSTQGLYTVRADPRTLSSKPGSLTFSVESSITHRHLGGTSPEERHQQTVPESEQDCRQNTDEDDEDRAFNLKGLLGLETNKAPNLFTRKILKKMRKSETFKTEMFAKWPQENLSFGEIAKKLNVPYSHRNLQLLLDYINSIKAPSTAVARNPRVHFGGADVRYFD